MRTGLTKKQKTTVIYFDEHSRLIEVQTHNTDLKKRLTAFAAKYPQCCRQTDDDEQGGLTFEIEKGRLSFRLTAPYSEERRRAASERAKVVSYLTQSINIESYTRLEHRLRCSSLAAFISLLYIPRLRDQAAQQFPQRRQLSDKHHTS